MGTSKIVLADSVVSTPLPVGWVNEVARRVGCSRQTVFNALRKNTKGVKADLCRQTYVQVVVESERSNKVVVSFEEWASLMNEVYKVNDNGKWALLFAIMSAFRSDIKHDFTAPFFTGAAGCGKSEIAVSIRSLFVKLGPFPVCCLYSSTNAAFWHYLEECDAHGQVALFEWEWALPNYFKISGLKYALGVDPATMAVYPYGLPKNEPAMVFFGHTLPRDLDLVNRLTILNVGESCEWSEEEVLLFKSLKALESNGLSGVLEEIRLHKNIIKNQFLKTYNELIKKLETEFIENDETFSFFSLNNVALFVTMAKLIEDYIPELQLPFSFDEFYLIAKNQITKAVAVEIDDLELDQISRQFLADNDTVKVLHDRDCIKLLRLKEVARFVIVTQKASVSLIQRNFSLDYKIASSIMDQLKVAGIVGLVESSDGTKAYQVLVSDFDGFDDSVLDKKEE